MADGFMKQVRFFYRGSRNVELLYLSEYAYINRVIREFFHKQMRIA